jgi:hypothetical protein
VTSERATFGYIHFLFLPELCFISNQTCSCYFSTQGVLFSGWLYLCPSLIDPHLLIFSTQSVQGWFYLCIGFQILLVWCWMFIFQFHKSHNCSILGCVIFQRSKLWVTWFASFLIPIIL